MSIESWSEKDDGELTASGLRSKLASRGYSVHCYTYPPGTYFPEHAHNVDKIDAVVSGTFKMTMHGKEYILKAGDYLAVPAGEVHSAEVVGNEPVVSLDAIKL